MNTPKKPRLMGKVREVSFYPSPNIDNWQETILPMRRIDMVLNWPRKKNPNAVKKGYYRHENTYVFITKSESAIVTWTFLYNAETNAVTDCGQYFYDEDVADKIYPRWRKATLACLIRYFYSLGV